MTVTANDIPVWIDPQDSDCVFPDVSLALTEPNGLLAIGGNLSSRCLLNAYEQGIFPWFNAGQPVLWWCPDPRSVLFPEEIKISRSLKKTIARNEFTVTLDTVFAQVIDSCAAPRPSASGTWITREMKDAYCQLFELGYAHSVETWHNGKLVGGLYGVALGGVFFGESMFFRKRDASKVAFTCLVRQLGIWGYTLIDCQIASQHLASLGAREISRREFCKLLRGALTHQGQPAPWNFDAPLDTNLT
jgi:leucyl/phenylalanyl-tRNA---protein transferase